MEKRKTYRVVFKHEVHFMARSKDEAKMMFNEIDIGHLARSMIRYKGLVGHCFLGIKSVECMLEHGYEEVK